MSMFLYGFGKYNTDKQAIREILLSDDKLDIKRKWNGEFLQSPTSSRDIPMKLVDKVFKEMRKDTTLDSEKLADRAEQLKDLELEKNPGKIKLSKDGTKIKAIGLWNRCFSGAYSRAKDFDVAEKTLSIPRAYLYEHGFGVKKDLRVAIEYYKLSAEQGNAEAQNRLGELYYSGTEDDIVEKDLVRAEYYFKAAALKNHAAAKNNLAHLYEFNKGSSHIQEAARYYTQAAEQGNIEAQYNIGRLHERGLGVEKDDKKAFEYFKQAADQGHKEAKEKVIYSLKNGIGVEKDLAEAERYGRARIKQPSRHIGALYERGEGVPKDLKKAVHYYEIGAGFGDVESQILLADCYLHGKGLEKDVDKAIEYYTEAANQGSSAAAYQLGEIYETIDLKTSREWYLTSAEASNDTGLFLKLAEDFRKDNDWEQALYCYACAKDLDDPEAFFQIGRLYETGVGKEKDLAQAIFHYEKAAAQDHSRAINRLGRICENNNNFEEACEYYKQGAKLGNLTSQFNLGLLYKREFKDLKRAEKYFRMAAGQGDSDSQTNLGGLLIEKGEYQEAIKWFKLAADQKDSLALYNLGTLYEDGLGVQVDLQKALNYYRRAAELGDEESQVEAARLERELL